MGPEFTPEDVRALVVRQPDLAQLAPGILEGDFHLDAVYDGLVLQDTFRVRITARNPSSGRPPVLEEVGGRTKKIVAKYALPDIRTLHRNGDGTACVCVLQSEREKFPAGASLLDFVDNLVTPYLYGLTYFDKIGKWPWQDYSHGALGLLEFYADAASSSTKEEFTDVLRLMQLEERWADFAKQLKQPDSVGSCPCGSGKRFIECHERAFRGLQNAHTELRRLELLDSIQEQGKQ